ncbi:MAG: glycosyltransferase family 39 protein [Bacilli bacterium]|nr:glycosyltransferase family 39 protein [Bacilli bacterium]
MKVFNYFFTIIFMFLSLFILYKTLSNNKKIREKKLCSNKCYKILFCFILLIGIFIRVYKFGSVPDGFNQDGAMAVVDGIALAEYGTDRYGMFMPVHLTAWGYGQMSSLLSYMVALFVKIFGFSIIVVRLPILIISIISMICLYLFSKDVFGKNVALIVLFMTSINPWHIMQSRWILDCNLFPHFIIMGVYFLNKGLSKKVYLWISMILFGLSMYCYGISIYTIPVFLLATCIYLIKTKKITIKDAFISFIIYILVAWPFILTMVINFLKIDTIKTPFFTIPFFESSTRSKDILFFSDNILSQLIINIIYFINVIIIHAYEAPWNYIEGFGTLYYFTIPFIIIGCYVLFKKYKKSSGSKIIFILLLTSFWCGIATNEVNINRLNIIYYPIIIISSIGVYFIMQYLKRFKWSILLVYLCAFIMFGYTYFTSYSETIGDVFFKDFKNAILSLKTSDSKKFYITPYVQSQSSYDVAEILTLFYLEIDSKYYRGLVMEDGLSFKEKYNIKNIDSINIDYEEDAEYVVTYYDLQYFDKSKVDIKEFGRYYVVSLK